MLSKPQSRSLLGLIIVATALTGAIVVYAISRLSPQSQPAPTTVSPSVQQVTALGRLEPETEIIRIAAPRDLDGDRLGQWLVKEGDHVKARQAIVILDSRDRLQAAVTHAQEQVRVAQAKLAQVKAGAKVGEIEAQRATIARLDAEQRTEVIAQRATIARLQAQQRTEIAAQQATIARLKAALENAKVEVQRHETLYQQGAIAATLRDSKQLAMITAQQSLNEAQANLQRLQATFREQLNEAQANLDKIQSSRVQQLNEARATLNRIAEVRPVDVNAAQMEIDSAIAALRQARTDLEQSYIRAPMNGQILKVQTRQGEKISDNGIADFGQTERMIAVAEVYQTDIGKIRMGQTAIVTGQAFAGELRGTVSQIDLQVSRQNVFSNQPGENLDRRVVEVKIRLNPEDSQKVASLTNLQVQVAIQQ
jgi:HlyD family secretion protein